MSATTWPRCESLTQIRDLDKYCQRVNQHVEYRTQRYLDLLVLVEQAITTAFERKHLNTSRSCYNIIHKNLPSDVRANQAIVTQQKICRLVFDNQAKVVDLHQKLRQPDSYKDPDILNKAHLAGFASRHHVPLSDDSVHGENCARVRKERRIHSILSIDGGGIRGIIPASMLVEIEKITRKPVSGLFDLIGGTSTGGILALGSTVPDAAKSGKPLYKAEDLLKLYTEEHRDIFVKNPEYCFPSVDLSFADRQFWKIRYPKYACPMPLFSTKFGSSYLSSALTDVLITTNTEESVIQKVASIATAGIGSIFTLIADRTIISHDIFPKHTHFFTKKGFSRVSYSLKDLEEQYSRKVPPKMPRISVSSYDLHLEEEGDFNMAFVAKSTSAAPTFFPLSGFNGRVLVDGGLLQNNPAIPCVLSALKEHRQDDLFMVSLGTGEFSGTSTHKDPLSMWFDVTQPAERTEDVLREILPRGGYNRFQYLYKSPPPDLDQVDESTISDLVQKGRELVEESQEYLRYVCKILDPGSI